MSVQVNALQYAEPMVSGTTAAYCMIAAFVGLIVLLVVAVWEWWRARRDVRQLLGERDMRRWARAHKRGLR